ncbi:hypothetical protein EOL96_01805 [Candidatus Saccharibacteria bacterium]|nr:hypothetical protein [Candidatus Saccharibacteria bacterium]
MLILGSSLLNIPVLSLQTGAELARTSDFVIDPSNLRITAFLLDGPLLPHKAISLLRIADIREMSDIGIIVDSSEEFIEPEDVIKVNDVYLLHFQLINMLVTDEKNNRLGKVTDFTVDTTSFITQQLTVRRPLLHSLNDTELIIHRSQIIEINNKSIVVHSEASAPEPELQEVVGSYVNPFRKNNPAHEPTSTDSL